MTADILPTVERASSAGPSSADQEARMRFPSLSRLLVREAPPPRPPDTAARLDVHYRELLAALDRLDAKVNLLAALCAACREAHR